MTLQYRPPLALPRLTAEGLRGSESGVWVEPPGHARRLFRYAPEFIDDPAAIGMFDRIGPDVYRSPPVFVASCTGADLVGYRTLIHEDGFCDDEALLSETAEAGFLDKLASDDPFLNENTGLRRCEGGEWRFIAGDRHLREIPGTTSVLCSHEPSNYGSFLFRVLPKLLVLRQLGLDHLPMLVWAAPPAFRRLLGLLGVEEGRIIQHELGTVTRLEHAIAPSLRNPHAYLDRESWALLQTLSDRCMGELSGRRLYISRLSHGKVSGSTRVMQNEDALAAALAQLNFEVIEPQLLTTEEQIATFASADMIVGPSGSAMFNVVFARPGTKVIDIESEPNWIYAHAGLFASCQMRYGLFVGECDPADTRPAHRSWTVDIPVLMDRISDFIRA